MNPVLITSSIQMDAFIEQLGADKLIAVDTEFFRETTYYPQLALVQIATDTIVVCIDPLAFDARPALKKILLDHSITKIFHSCSQDLEVLYYYLDAIPAPIYDTQIANALVSDQHQIGYASLVETELNVCLDKSQTRTNWLQRPLTDKQLQYAADDVVYLYQLQHKLDEKLQALGRDSWFEEDSVAINNNNTSFEVPAEKLWQRVKGSNRLKRRELAIVQHIAQWREVLAQKKDITRRRILSDELVIKLAINTPDNIAALDLCIGNRYGLDSVEKQHLLELITAAIQSEAEFWPDNRFIILDNQQKTLLKDLQQLINGKAEELGISSAILSSRKDLEYLITRNIKTPDESLPNIYITRGWRYHCIGHRLIETLKTDLKNSK